MSVSEDFLILTGSFQSKYEVLKRALPGHFVELDKDTVWFLKGVGGAKIAKGDLKPVQVLQEICQQYLIASGYEPNPASPVAENENETQEGNVEDEDDDPMNTLDDLQSPKPKAKRKPKRAQVSPRAK